jgi:hypothetical protein
MSDTTGDLVAGKRRERVRQDLESRLKVATGLELRNAQGNLDNLAGDKLERFVKWCEQAVEYLGYWENHLNAHLAEQAREDAAPEEGETTG